LVSKHQRRYKEDSEQNAEDSRNGSGHSKSRCFVAQFSLLWLEQALQRHKRQPYAMGIGKEVWTLEE
jgi:hypothetical protein